MNARIHVVVRGVVQGVGFRYFVYQRAVSLGLAGFVQNLYSGEVEVEAEGDRGLLEEFLKEVTIGPRSAHVSDVQVKWLKSTQAPSGFEVR